MPADFTNREIEHMFNDIKNILERVEAQVIKTNGRVTALEMWKEGVMAKFTGVVATLGILWVAIKELLLK